MEVGNGVSVGEGIGDAVGVRVSVGGIGVWVDVAGDAVGCKPPKQPVRKNSKSAYTKKYFNMNVLHLLQAYSHIPSRAR